MCRVIKIIFALLFSINLIIRTSSNQNVCVSDDTDDFFAPFKIKGDEIQSVSMMSEIHQTMALSMFIYALVDIRDKVNRGVLKIAPGCEIDLPQPASSLLKAAKCALAGKTTRCVAEPDNDYSDDLVNVMKEEDMTNDADRAYIKTLSNIMDEMSGFDRYVLEHTIVAYLYDTKKAISQSRVYGIAIDHTNKRVLVAFRGSASISDWVRDFNLPLNNIKDPTSNDSTKVVGVHSGFFDALLGKDGEGENSCKKMHEHCKDTHAYGCVAETVKCLGLIEKGYRLYVTGHSLGGALATLFGFFAASDDYFVQNGHVTIYSYASPKIGNSSFRDAFRYLEVNDRLRHARIRHKWDPISRAPPGYYMHVGVQVQMNGDKNSGKRPEIEYSSATKNEETEFGPSFNHPHSTELIFEQLKSWREIFDTTELEQLYHKFMKNGLPKF